VRPIQEEDSAAEREDQYRDRVYVGLAWSPIAEDKRAADEVISLGSEFSANGDGVTVTSNYLKAANDVISLGSESSVDQDGVAVTLNDCAISDSEGPPLPALKFPPSSS
jgi:hypothetical protein